MFRRLHIAAVVFLALAVSAFTPWTRFELHTASYQVALETSALASPDGIGGRSAPMGTPPA